MSLASVNLKLDDREEGEIIDDENVFEDISDNSISDIEGPFSSGKSVLHKETLRTLSLSSVSDIENQVSTRVQHQHGRKNRRRKRSRSEKRNAYLKRRMSAGSDSDCGSKLKKRIKKQLKEAIRIDTSEHTVTPHNSLKDRLQGMVKLNDKCCTTSTEVKSVMISSSENDLVRNVNGECDKGTEYDRELQELRLEALKTAILNKHKHRKKRALGGCEENVMSDSSQKSDVLENNKENSARINNLDVAEPVSIVCKPADVICVDVTDSQKTDLPSPAEEDADTLRASLLASMNKVTKVKPVDKTSDTIGNKVIEIETVDSPTAIQVNVKNAKLNKSVRTGAVDVSMKNKSQSDVKIVTSSKIIRQKTFPGTPGSSKNRVVNNMRNHFPQTRINRDIPVLDPVKPLIITIGEDSDSDDDPIFNEESLDTKVKQQNPHLPEAEITVPKEIEKSVEHFLKQERAKVEAESTNKVTPQKNEVGTEILEKSVVKLLPQDKQVEYRNLLSEIRIKTHKNVQLKAMKLSSNMKTTNKVVNTKHDTITRCNKAKMNVVNTSGIAFVQKTECLSGSVMPRLDEIRGSVVARATKVVPPPDPNRTARTLLTNSIRKSIKLAHGINRQIKINGANARVVTNEHVSNVRDSSESVFGSTTVKQPCHNLKATCDNTKKLEDCRFRSTIKDMQFQHNGRLQIKVQYQSLNNLINQIKGANVQKKKHELHVKKLLEELCEARKQVSQCYKSYTCLVSELINKKELIDKSTEQVVLPQIITTKENTLIDNSKLNCAATVPSAVNLREAKSVIDSFTNGDKIESQKPPDILSKDVRTEIPEKDPEIDNGRQESSSDRDTQRPLFSATNEEMNTMVECQGDIKDSEQTVPIMGAKVIGNYVSPLGNYSRCQAVDPLAILCPYEVSGSCRDAECKFTHFGENSAKT